MLGRGSTGVLALVVFALIGNGQYSSGEADDYIRAVDDMVAHKITFKPYEEGLSLYPDSEDGEDEEKKKEEESAGKTDAQWVQMMSADQEEYQCLLPPPLSSLSKKRRIEEYSGLGPSELLQPLYSDPSCSYRIEAYWVYEVCHGRYIVQYHEEKESKLRTEFYLGNFDHFQAAADASKFDQLNPPTRKIGEEELAYFPVTYIRGTQCDLTGQPRVTTLLYACDETARNHIYSINEISSCNYEIIVLTSRLCVHPSFQPAPSKELEVRCFAARRREDEDDERSGYSDSAADARPKALAAAEKETSNSFFREFTFSHKSAADIFRNLLQNAEEVEANSDDLAQINSLLSALKSPSLQQPPASGRPGAATGREIIERFWKGKQCLKGGAGWWKYEFCYGRTVKQYHEEAGKQRTEIVLGTFDEKLHKSWADLNPTKARKVDGNGKVYQASNLYTKGDVCKETGAHRSCEVRMRCSTATENTDINRVLIYLIEPDTCNYVLVLESGLFCDGLQSVDNYGLLPEMPPLGTIVEETSDVPSTSEHPSFSMTFTYTETNEMVESSDEEQQSERGELPKKVKIVRIERNDLLNALSPNPSSEEEEEEEGEQKKGGKSEPSITFNDEAIASIVKSLLPTNAGKSPTAEEDEDSKETDEEPEQRDDRKDVHSEEILAEGEL